MKRVLLFTSGTLPIDSRMPATGDGLRAWQIYQGLKSQGFDVGLSLYKGVYDKFQEYLTEDLGGLSFDLRPGGQDHVIEIFQPDVIVVTHWPAKLFGQTEIPVAIDFHGPHMIERYFQKFETINNNLRDKLLRIRDADFFTCAGEYQKYYFFSMLLRAGITNVVNERLIYSIPISLDPCLPNIDYQKKADHPIRFIYSGMFLPWQNPFGPFKTSMDRFNKDNKGVLEIFGGKHPVYPMDTSIFDSFLEESKNNLSLRVRGLIPRNDLIEEYKTAHVALDLMSWNLERELAFTTRTIEYLWAGLPVIYNAFSEISEYIKKYNAGWCIDPEDSDELGAVLDEILADPHQLIELSMNAQELVRECFTWDKTISPLKEFCKNPKKRDRSMDVSFEHKTSTPEGTIIGRTIRCYKDNGLEYTSAKMMQYLKEAFQ
jgi:glycosyltransferase involved in cell wall biosynthesis